MNKSWLRKLFCSARTLQLENTQTKADLGDADAQFSIGFRFANGDGKAQDDTLAARWYLSAANQNHPSAQYNLGIMLAEGRGVLRDNTQAMLWIRKAAQQGHAGAQHQLGLRYRRASFAGGPANALESNLEAYKWFGLAAAQGYEGSEAELGSIALGMTREQVLEGNQRLAAFARAECC
jgi:uncharacterized protein